MRTLTFDVMLNGYFVKTFKYEFCPAFPIKEEELVNFVVSRLPTLRNKPFRIMFNETT